MQVKPPGRVYDRQWQPLGGARVILQGLGDQRDSEGVRPGAGGVLHTVVSHSLGVSSQPGTSDLFWQEEAGPSGGYPGRQFAALQHWAEEKASLSAGSRRASPEVWTSDSTVKDYRLRLPGGAASWHSSRRCRTADGVVPELEVSLLSIWVVGHSFIKWAHRKACRTAIGENLGLDRTRYHVRWDARGGLRWCELLPRLSNLAGQGFCPDILIIHAGENDLVKATGLDLMKSMKKDLEEIQGRWRGCHVLFTGFVPHRVWWGAKKPSAIEKARRKLNKEIRSFCTSRSITFMEHKGLPFENVEFFWGDGVHLPFMGMELFYCI
ncbi:hypothetical protein NDU88_000621 [Pleurodeles waltl]|uniref:SGNH hydrolase-type esterase domain-containing protein n=1 Tax=Pleurodeles waltl TaxID=8319 RepID=A0AAV7SXU3_PLEWA|nr:hypothetical protein NDU88_000621 [Pleurodeles waltl]